MKQEYKEKDTKFFNDLSQEEQDAFYKEEFEAEGVFNKYFPDQEMLDLDSADFSQIIRNDIIRLLLKKGVLEQEIELEKLHEYVSAEQREYNFDNGVNNISQLFYENDEEFDNNYHNFVKFLKDKYFDFPFYYQTTPTIRLHCPNAKNSDHYPRYHTDIGYGHPPQEINLWIPLTKAIGEQKHGFKLMSLANTRKILSRYNYNFPNFINDAINDKVFSKECADLSEQAATPFGKSLAFDARCIHSGEPLINHTRVSIDIRIIAKDDYEKMPYKFQGAGKRKIIFEPGTAYSSIG